MYFYVYIFIYYLFFIFYLNSILIFFPLEISSFRDSIAISFGNPRTGESGPVGPTDKLAGLNVCDGLRDTGLRSSLTGTDLWSREATPRRPRLFTWLKPSPSPRCQVPS